MKKLIFENFKYAMLPKSATRMIAGGITCQVIDCHGQKCTASDGGKTECCGDRTGKECWHASIAQPGYGEGLGN